MMVGRSCDSGFFCVRGSWSASEFCAGAGRKTLTSMLKSSSGEEQLLSNLNMHHQQQKTSRAYEPPHHHDQKTMDAQLSSTIPPSKQQPTYQPSSSTQKLPYYIISHPTFTALNNSLTPKTESALIYSNLRPSHCPGASIRTHAQVRNFAQERRENGLQMIDRLWNK